LLRGETRPSHRPHEGSPNSSNNKKSLRRAVPTKGAVRNLGEAFECSSAASKVVLKRSRTAPVRRNPIAHRGQVVRVICPMTGSSRIDFARESPTLAPLSSQQFRLKIRMHNLDHSSASSREVARGSDIEVIDPSPPQAVVVHADEIWLLIYSKAHVNVRQVPDGFLRQILYSTPSPQIDLQPHLPNTSTSPKSWGQRGFCPKSGNNKIFPNSPSLHPVLQRQPYSPKGPNGIT
jgi:hypothetical protein